MAVEPTSDQALPAISPATKRSNQPRWSLARGVLPQPVLGEGEVPAERLRQVGVGGGQLDHSLRELWDRQAAAAVLGRDAQRPEAGLLEPAHRLERQLAVELALEGAGGDTVQERGQLRAHLVEAPAAERRPVEAGQAQAVFRGCSSNSWSREYLYLTQITRL